ncbi:MAG: restriction endonuclease subunit S [Undibacterium umbellatum]|uniref:restriction endonuclease subunit S n=1 Tax=Undibacterium umbellatum TaxID=2762300 RepID=UPI003BB77B90
MSELPKGWEATNALEVADPIRGVSYKKEQIIFTPAVGFTAVLRANNIQDNQLLFDDLVYVPNSNISADQRLKIGDIVIAMSSGSISVVGKSAQVSHDVDASFGAFCGALRPKLNIESRYLGLFLKSDIYRKTISNLARGSNINNLKWAHFDEIPLPLAPLPEQKRIADKLDTVLARVDACRERLNRVPLILKRFKQSVLAAATSGKLTEDWRNGNATSPTGCSDKEQPNLRTIQLGNLCDSIFDGPFGSNLKSDDYTAGGERVIRLENIGHLNFDKSKETYVSKEKYQNLIKHRISPGDILFSSFVDEEIRVCQFPGDLPTNAINKADCFCIRPNKAVLNAKYLTFHLACRKTYTTLKEQVHGATRPRINLKHLKQFEIILPSLTEQQEIVRRVETLFAFADRLEARLSTARNAADRLTPALLAKAFRGELVDQDPNDEPASLLLQRLTESREIANAKPGGGRTSKKARVAATSGE